MTDRSARPDDMTILKAISEKEREVEAMIDEARKRNIIIHRVVATVGGSTYCDFEEFEAMAQMAKIRVMMDKRFMFISPLLCLSFSVILSGGIVNTKRYQYTLLGIPAHLDKLL